MQELTSPTAETSRINNFGSEVRVIGPRRSGKTTYLATLAYFPHQKELMNKLPGLKIMPTSDDAATLSEQAENFLKQGLKLAGTRREDIYMLPDFSFGIEIPAFKKFPPINIELTVKDFAGEIFEDLIVSTEWDKEAYLGDLFSATGWLILLTDWDSSSDKKLYKSVFKKLCERIADEENLNPEIKNLKIAVVMSKCERGELWPCRRDPDEDLFKVRLPETYQILTQSLSSDRINFFACSSFGVLNDNHHGFDPRPNRYIPDGESSSEYHAYLRDPERWKPYGLITPLYWLATGKTIPELHWL